MSDSVESKPAVRWAGFESYLLDQVEVGVVATDLDGTVTHWNRHAEALYGWGPQEALGRTLFELVVRPSDAGMASQILETVRGGQSWEGDLHVRRKDETDLLVHLRISPITDPHGVVVGLVGVSVDIADRVRHEQRLETRTAVSRILAEADTLDDAAPRLLETVCRTLGWEVGTLFRTDRERGALHWVDTWAQDRGAARPFIEATRATVFERGVGVPGSVWASGRATWIQDVSKDSRFVRGSSAPTAGVRSGFAFPIQLRGQLLGVMEFFTGHVREPDQDLIDAMTLIGLDIGQFIERREAESVVRHSEALKTGILEAALDCVVVMDPEGRIVEFNPASERTFGHRREDVIGRPLAEVIIPPSLRARHWQGLARYLATGEAVVVGTRTELTGLRSDGTEFPVEVAVSRIDVPGGPLFTGYLRDLTVQKRAEREVKASRDHLEAIFQSVSEGITVQAPDGRLIFANEEAARMIGYGSAAELLAAPLEEVIERFELRDEEGRPFPGDLLPGRLALRGERPPAAVVRYRTKPTGEERWSIVSATPVLDDSGTVRFAVNVFRDLTERKRAEDAQRFLADASAALSESLDYDETLRRIAQFAVPRLADWCAVTVVGEDGSLRQMTVKHVDPEKVRLAEELGRRYPPDPNTPTGVPNVLRTGRSELYPEVPDELLVRAARDPDHLEILRSLGIRSGMILPLRARNRILGAITFVAAESGRRYGSEDVILAEDLAHRAALAMDNSRLYSEQARVAEALQRSLLPPTVPAIPGIEVEGRYQAAGAGIEVGGDFYDVFRTGDRNWALVIGDVCGKGPEAAAVTGLARYTVRAAAMQEDKPSRILETLNEALLKQRSDRLFCTVAYVRLRVTNGASRATISCAGHPMPLVLRADGTVEMAGQPGTLLGIFPDPDLSDRMADLRPGDALVLFTDGVIEEHRGSDPFGLERLMSLLAGCAGMDAAGIADTIEGTVLELRPAEPRDDIAILVVRVKP